MFDTLVWLKFHKELFDFNEDVYMCCAYIPPSNSSHHALYDCELFRVLENSITTYSTKGKVCLVGDLNSRTAYYDDFITDDSIHSSLQDRLNKLCTYTNDLCLSKRMNPDKSRNEYCSKLLKLCKSTGLRILNGRHRSGYANDYAYCGATSLSVIDYLISIIDLFNYVDRDRF
jgi:hypothetical protein